MVDEARNGLAYITSDLSLSLVSRTGAQSAAAEFLPGGPLRHKLITVAAHGEKMPRLLRVVFQLLPQPAHVNVNGAGQHSGFIAPNLAQQFIARKRSAPLGDKVA